MPGKHPPESDKSSFLTGIELINLFTVDLSFLNVTLTWSYVLKRLKFQIELF